MLGRTNVPEFTLEGYTHNEFFGVTRNPWNTDLTPGGSTGGGAAGVVAGLVPAALDLVADAVQAVGEDAHDRYAA